MQEIIKKYEKKIQDKNAKRRKLKIVTAIASLAVVCIVLWALILPGVAMSGQPKCGKEEHRHSDACYTEKLTCGQKETDGHTHTDACYKTEKKLICGQEESETHQHTDACYQEEKTLICGKQEEAAHHHTAACYTRELTCGKEEHTHTDECYSDPTADVENEDSWTTTFRHAELGDDWGKNVAAIAETQIGYRESSNNYSVSENREHKGYTRYTAWYGDYYKDWDTAFAAFCIHYAGVPDDAFPTDIKADEWIKKLQEKDWYTDKTSEDYQVGDLIFLHKKNQETDTQVGVISKIFEKDGKTYIQTIEGNCDNQVKKNEYAADDENISGYGLLCKAQMKYKADQMTQENAKSEAKAEETASNTADSTTDDTAQVQAVKKSNVQKKRKVFYSSRSVNEDNASENTATVSEEGPIKITDAKVKLETKATTSETENGYSRDKQFEFSLFYKLGNQITETNNKAYYDLPDELTDISSAAYSQTGTIWDGDIAVGNYKIVKVTDENGKEHSRVIFEYTNKDWIEEHGSNVTGTFRFYAKISKTASNNQDEVKIRYDGSSEPIYIKFEDGKVTGRKEHNLNSDGTMDCTITFDVKGKDATVKLKDVLGNNLEFVSGTFKLDGNPINDLVSGKETKLNKLTIGTHRITYKVKVKNINNTNATNNKIEWSWGENDKHKDEYDDRITFQKEGIKKEGNYNYVTGKMDWTITVTPSQFKSVKGTIINDVLSSTNHKYDGKAVICTNPWSVEKTTIAQISLDSNANSFSYTFNEKTDAEYGIGQTYYIKYSTLPNDWEGEGDGKTYHTYKNTVNENESSAGVTEPGNGGNKPNPGDDKDKIDIVTKDAIALPNKKILWQITIDPNKYKGENKELTYLHLSDSLTNTGWSGSKYDQSSFKILDEDGNVLGYEKNKDYTLTFGTDSFDMNFITLPNKKIVVSYITYTNNNNTNQSNNVKSTYTIDGKSNQETDSAQSGYQEMGAPMQKDGTIDGKKITWKIVVDCTESHYWFKEGSGKTAGIYTIKDILPDGLTYIDGSAKYSIQDDAWTKLNQTDNAEITPRMGNDGELLFDFDIKYSSTNTNPRYAPIKITLTFDTYINTPLPTKDGKGLKATKSGVTYHNDTDFSKDGTIYSKASADAEIKNKYLTKAGSVGKNNIINYKLVINYEAADLIPDSDYINLVDKLDPNCEIDLKSIKVKDLNTNQEVAFTQNYSTEGTLTLKVPDSKALIVEYKVRVFGEVNDTLRILNQAHLEGIDSANASTETETKIVQTEATVSGNKDSVTLIKIDDTTSAKLEGAEFELYQVTNNYDNGTKVKAGKTDSEGKLIFERLNYDTVYYYQEVKAPNGYTKDTDKHYFIIRGDNYQNFYNSIPDDVKAKIKITTYIGGNNVLVSNKEDKSYTLPATGGTGTTGYLAGGAALMCLAALLYGYQLRRKRERGTM